MVVAARVAVQAARPPRAVRQRDVNQKNVLTVPRVVTVALAKSVRVKRKFPAALTLLMLRAPSAAVMAAVVAVNKKRIGNGSFNF